MKKLLSLLTLVLFIAAFVWWHFSAPRVLMRQCDALLSHLNFGMVSLGNVENEADDFASLLARRITFTGPDNPLVEGEVSRSELRDQYLSYRSSLKNSSAERTGETTIDIQSPTTAIIETTIELKAVAHGNSSRNESLPCRLTWTKSDGHWLLSGVQLKEPEK